VRSISPTEVVLARTSREALDVGTVLAIRTSAGQGPAVLVRVVELTERDARAAQVAVNRDQGVNHGDPVEFVAGEPRGPAG
jgi:hypothetical protein